MPLWIETEFFFRGKKALLGETELNSRRGTGDAWLLFPLKYLFYTFTGLPDPP
jgi:hypothetical protein